MKSVAIFGMGIAGLSSAHELAEKGYDVSIYEILPEIGGVARSYREDSESPPSQYSYRGYGNWYHNAFDIMKRIPTENGKTVYDNLTRPVGFIFTQGTSYFMSAFSTQDKIVLGIEIARVATSGPHRKEYYASINSAEYMRPKMSEEGWKRYISMFGPWVGIDPQRASHFHVIDFLIKCLLPGSPSPHTFQDEEGEWSIGNGSKWLVFNQPENEAWFDPWMKYLKTLNVKFHFNTELFALKCDPASGKIESVQVKHHDNTLSTVRADDYVIVISPIGMVNVLKNTIQTDPNVSPVLVQEYHRYLGLTQDGPHIQVSFRLGFNKEFEWTGKRTAVVVSTSEFNITMYRQEEMWKKGTHLGSDIKSLWSGTACVSYVPGTLYGKPVTSCTKEEFEREILHQLSKDPGFNQILQQHNGKTFKEILPHMIHFEIWKNWKFEEPSNG